MSPIVTTPALLHTERHDAFLHSVTSGREPRGAPSCRDMYATTIEHARIER
jgi:hypothetical protein